MKDNHPQTFKIRSRYYRLVGTLIGAFLLLAVLTAVYITTEQNRLSEEREAVREKNTAVENLADHLNGVMFRARGYYAFQDPWELNRLYENLDNFKTELDAFAQLELTEEEQRLERDLQEFYMNYTTNLLPRAISYVENDDYAALRALSSGGANTEVNNFLDYTNRFKEEGELRRERIYEETLALSNRFKVIMVAIAGLGFLMIVFLVGRMLRGIVFPVEELSNTAKAITKGDTRQVEFSYPPNEIGALADAFREMIQTVHQKEEELTSQNEELLSQQEELENQQQQLRDYLLEIENIKKALDQSASVCITDDRGVIVSINDRFTQSTGYRREELVGNTTRILKSGYHPDSFYENMWETIRRGKIWNKEMKNKGKNDEFFWFNATIVPYLNEEGKPYQYILIGIDVTETKEVQQKLKEYLEEMQRTKNKIEKYSALNQSLTMTLDKEAFFDIVFTYFQENYGFDKGILMDVKKKQYRAKGLRKEKTEALLEKENIEEILSRLEEEKFFTITRKAFEDEQGVAEEAFHCYDFYTGIFSTEGTVEGFFALTRLGSSFREGEIEEINGLMKQLAVALSRIDMYEEVENTKNLNENIIENVNEGLQLVSLEGRMLQYNKVLIDLLKLKGYEGKQRLEQSFWIKDFIEGVLEKEKLEEFFRESIEFSTRKSKTLRFTLEGDPPVFVEIYASPVFMHEEKIGTIFVYRDITKEYEVDRMKSELVSTVSHELRTPLSSVLGFSEMLLMKELKPERQKKYLKTIHKEATRLTNLINDFLDLQRMESGKQEYTMELHSVNAIAMEGVEKFKHETKHNINIVDNARFARAKVDRDRITQVFTNLISNSIKFSPEGGDVTITLQNQKEDLVVTIKDQGMGIPEGSLANIFDKFRRSDNSETRKIGGTGLGLSICKEIIEAHGGEIRMESIENVGTTVHFSLPAYMEGTEGNHGILEEESEDPSHGSRDNVMLVEDDISLALLLSETLKAQGFKVFHHIRPQSALKNAKETVFSAIVVDLMLGDEMTGWDLIKELNEHKTTKEIPVIISSALEKSQESFKNYNVHDYLVKPYSAEELLRVLLEIQEKKKSK